MIISTAIIIFAFSTSTMSPPAPKPLSQHQHLLKQHLHIHEHWVISILTWTTVKGLHRRGTSWEPPRTTTPNVPLSFSNVTWSSNIIVILKSVLIMMVIVMTTWMTFVLALGLGPTGGRRYFTSSCTLSVVSSFWSRIILYCWWSWWPRILRWC